MRRRAPGVPHRDKRRAAPGHPRRADAPAVEQRHSRRQRTSEDHRPHAEARRQLVDDLTERRWRAPGELVARARVLGLPFSADSRYAALVVTDLPVWAELVGHEVSADVAETPDGPWWFAVRMAGGSESKSTVFSLGDRTPVGHRLWAYTNFSQFLIIWSANIAEEAPYYLRRMSGGWGWVGAFLIAFHFFAPFFMLLNRAVKKNINALVKVAIFILFLRFMDLCFLILPSAHPQMENQGILDLVSVLVAAFAVVGIGGLWLFLFFRFIVARPLLPVNEPYLQEAPDFRGGH